MKLRQNILDTDTSLFGLVLFHLSSQMSGSAVNGYVSLWRHVINLTELFQTVK